MLPVAEIRSGRGSTAPSRRESSIRPADEPGLAPVLLEAPTAIPGYRIEQVLERRPGSWTVYRATEVAGGELVALTILGSQLNHDRAYGKRLLEDMRRLQGLEHPHLVPVLAAGRAQRGLFVASELPDLITLEATLALRVLQPDDLIRLFEPIADLLDRAHAQGLLHRGLSPASIVMAPEGHARVTGFGLADSVAAARGSDVGMLPYMAPEQIAGDRLSARTDVYGLAATMLSPLTGVDPGSPSSRVSRPLSAARERRAGVPQEVDRILSRALANAPGRRPASAGGLIEELRAAIVGPGAVLWSEPATVVPRPAVASPARPPETAPQRRGRRRLAALIGAAVLAAVAGTAFAALSSDTGDPPARQTSAITASTDRLTLIGPSGWSLVKRPAAVAGLPLTQTVALSPRRPGQAADGVLTAGFVADVDARLLPPELDAQLATTPLRERVRIGRYEGYRYAGLQLRGSAGTLDLYVVPTTGGAATVACRADGGSQTFLRRCEGVATTLVLTGDTAEPVGPSRDYIAALGDTVDDLNAERRNARLGLARARTAADQGRLAGALAQAYETAARRQVGAPRRLSTARFNDQLVQGLRTVRDAYRALAVAARQGNRSEYAAQRLGVLERERSVTALLESFGES